MPSEKELEDFIRRGQAAQDAVDTITTPTRRRGERSPVDDAKLVFSGIAEAFHYAMIPMPEYEVYRMWRAKIDDLANAIERGRLEGKIEAYGFVLRHVQTSQVLSPIIPDRARLEGILGRVLSNLQADLDRLGPEPSGPSPEPHGPADDREPAGPGS